MNYVTTKLCYKLKQLKLSKMGVRSEYFIVGLVRPNYLWLLKVSGLCNSRTSKFYGVQKREII